MLLRAGAVLFDLDGVLVDSRAVVERTWRRWAERYALDPDSIIRIAHGRRTRDTLDVAAPDLATDAEVAWLDATELADVEGLRAVQGAREFLAALPPDRWAVVTSCGRSLALQRLTAVGLPVPDILVVSEDVRRGKPSPEGYQLAAARLGCSAPSCLVFEDAPAGLEAGREAGMRVIGLTTTHSARDLDGAEVAIPDLTAVRVSWEGTDFLVSVERA